MNEAFHTLLDRMYRDTEGARAYEVSAVRIDAIDRVVTRLRDCAEATQSHGMPEVIGMEPSVLDGVLNGKPEHMTVGNVAAVAAVFGLKVVLSPMTPDERADVSSIMAVPLHREVRVSSLTESDVPAVMALLDGLPALYPEGDAWLRDKIEDGLRGKARFTTLWSGTHLLGVSIETPKHGPDGVKVKLSSFCITDEFRGLGLGRFLASVLGERWTAEKTPEVYFTVAAQNYDGVNAVFEPLGFRQVAVCPNRYGEGRDELVFSASFAEVGT